MYDTTLTLSILTLLSLYLSAHMSSLSLTLICLNNLTLSSLDYYLSSQMYALYKDPEGKKVFDKTRPTDHPQQSNPESLEKTVRMKV